MTAWRAAIVSTPCAQPERQVSSSDAMSSMCPAIATSASRVSPLLGPVNAMIMFLLLPCGVDKGHLVRLRQRHLDALAVTTNQRGDPCAKPFVLLCGLIVTDAERINPLSPVPAGWMPNVT